MRTYEVHCRELLHLKQMMKSHMITSHNDTCYQNLETCINLIFWKCFVAISENVLICYGGYGVTDTWARAWADRLVTHSDLRNLAVGKVYAVKGPRDSLYNAKEISNSKLVQ